MPKPKVLVRKTYKFKLYHSKKTRHLVHRIQLAAEIWNHALSLHRRYYKVLRRKLNSNLLQKFIARLVKKPQFSHWKRLGSQAIQDIIQRMERAYARFFEELKKKRTKHRPPKFKSCQKYKSFTLKQAGYKIVNNQIKIGDITYKFHQSRFIDGAIKTVTIKRNNLGEIFIFLSCLVEKEPKEVIMTGQKAGFDFGLKTFLTDSNGNEYQSLQPFQQAFQQVQKAHRSLSSKKIGSQNRRKSKADLNRVYQKISHQREDFHWKLAHQLLRKYDAVYFETLNIESIKARWGRKTSDLAFSEFLEKLNYLALKHQKQVKKVDRWFPSSQKCHCCGFINKALKLSDREWQCPSCQVNHRRDVNAAKNILAVGVGTSTLRRDGIRLSENSALIDDARIPRL